MATAATIVSPTKPDHILFLQSRPSINEVRMLMSTAPEPDTSWDVAELHQTSEGYIVTRPRPEDRPEARKTLLGHYIDGASQHRDVVERIFTDKVQKVADEARAEARAQNRQNLELIERLEQQHRADSIRVQQSIHSIQNRLINQTESSVNFNDVTELYGVIARSLQGTSFNDYIFDCHRDGDNVLTAGSKEKLQSYGLGYLSRLLDPPEEIPDDIDTLRREVLQILSPEEEHLCRLLMKVQESSDGRHFLHHPRPDRATAMDRARNFLDDEAQRTLDDFLNTDPKRLPTRRERRFNLNADLSLFGEEGTYTNVATQREDLEDLMTEKADTESYLEVLRKEAE
ncbi:hypothetical protein K438DRAFT_1748175 [Mycena galopus ATCC 62051]|nr:hypothetical protein K438DRAFT_1748175 [Mycena galopus ATCC 62051]